MFRRQFGATRRAAPASCGELTKDGTAGPEGTEISDSRWGIDAASISTTSRPSYSTAAQMPCALSARTTRRLRRPVPGHPRLAARPEPLQVPPGHAAHAAQSWLVLGTRRQDEYPVPGDQTARSDIEDDLAGSVL